MYPGGTQGWSSSLVFVTLWGGGLLVPWRISSQLLMDGGSLKVVHLFFWLSPWALKWKLTPLLPALYPREE